MVDLILSQQERVHAEEIAKASCSRVKQAQGSAAAFGAKSLLGSLFGQARQTPSMIVGPAVAFSVLTGVPLGILAHEVSSKSKRESIREKALKAEYAALRNARKSLERGL